jgi:ABC-type uncharacterized transport system substrate-binding protein
VILVFHGVLGRLSARSARKDVADAGWRIPRLRVALILTTVAMFSGATVVFAQPVDKLARIGVLVTGDRPDEHVCVVALRRGLAELGYAEGQTHALEARWAEGLPEETFPRLAMELVRLHVDLIVAVTAGGLQEANQTIGTIPVVMAASSYPVERHLIASLARPGGNITGLATHIGENFAKRVQLLAEALPGVSRVAVLRIPGATNDWIVRDMQTAARQLGLKLQVIKLNRADDLPVAFHAATRGRAQAVMTTQGPFFGQHQRQFVELALKHKLPTFSGEPNAVDAGVLMSHGPSITESCRRSATFVHRILKGAKPADLPVEQPTKYELLVNLKTARALGITLPPSLLIRADRVIE